MNKRQPLIVLSIVLLTLTTASSYAQSLHFGVKAGTDLFKLSGRSFDGKTQAGFSGGAYGEVFFTRQWGIQPELLFNQTMANTSSDFNAIYPGTISTKISLNYISLPILLAFKPVPELSILVGPQYGYLVSQTTGLAQSNPAYPKDAFKKNDISIVFGGQLNLGKFKIGARYVIGLNDINNYPSSDTWKNKGFQFHLGYQLF
ncbi:porin family protein [Flavitalea flava]